MTRKMKDSGVEWIGEIPAGWEVCRLGNIAYITRGGSPRPIDEYLTEDKNALNWIKIGDTIKGNKYIKNTKQRIIKEGLKKTRFVTKGSLLLTNSMSFGEAYILDIDGCIHDGWLAFSNYRKIEKEYLYYTLISPLSSTQFSTQVAGGVVQNLNVEKVKKTLIVLPPLPEQTRIADYLDKKCEAIDAVIAKEETLIEKLKSYKHSLITEAVTKGITPGVLMEDSGVEWIGKIPVGWEIKRIRYLFKLREEKNDLPLNEVQLLSLYTELGVFPHGEHKEKGNKAVKAEGYKVVHKKDIIVNIILAWMGAIGISEYDGVTSPAYDIYEPLENVFPKFYHYLFRTTNFSSECYKYGKGIMAMRWRTYSSEFKNIKVAVPPLSEQTRIANYLDKKCEAIDGDIERRHRLIEKLTAYKKSLIYEVVTGKIEI